MEGEAVGIRNSRRLYIPIYFMILVLLLAIGMLKYYGKEVNSFAFKMAIIFSVICIFGTEIHRLRNYYEVNSSSLVHITGIFVKKIKRTDLTVISDVEIKQNPWQMLLHFGNVNALVFSVDSITPINNINNPFEFAEFLEKKMMEKRVGEHGQKKGRIGH